MRSIIEAVNSRISQHIFSEGGELPLKGHYEKIGGGNGWIMVKETGPASRMAMYNDGIKAFVAQVSVKPNGNSVYVIGRKSVWTPFDIPKLYQKFNEAENELIKNGNLWGGSDTIGGSPRETGSSLSTEDLTRIIKEQI